MASGMDRRGNPMRPWVWGAAAALLSLPLVAMNFFPAAGVDWTGSDFVVMGVVLFIACTAYEIGALMSSNWLYRVAFGIGVLTGFLIVWGNMAVGFIGNGYDEYNFIFLGVLAVGVVGALLTRFRADGMARTMVATAIAQLVAAGVAFALDSAYIAFLCACFAAPFLLSAALFRKAAGQQGSAGA